ncbi:MAG: FHA domain-containing protein [Bdellovibrionales bacterium]|nr:FHA domain-containing protein [Bdellovibrionales bacterium]
MSIQLTVMSLDFETNVAPSTSTYEKKEIYLGREGDNDVVLDLPEVSGKHAKLTAKRDDESGEPVLYITDLGSSNGTLVENNYIESRHETKLAPHQRIKIGRFLIKPFLNKDNFEKLIDIKLNIDEPKEVSDAPAEVASAPVEEAPESASLNGHAEQSERDEPVVTKTSNGAAVPNEPTSDTPLKDSVQSVAPLSTDLEADLEFDQASALIDSDIQDFDFVALQLCALRGRVTHHGRPLEGVIVDGGKLGRVTTGTDGSFAFTDVPESTRFVLTCSKRSFRFSQEGLTGVLDETTDLVIEATKLHTVRGRIIHRSSPLAGVTVDAGPFGRAVSGNDGTYEIQNVPEGTTLQLTASKDGFIFGRQAIAG